MAELAKGTQIAYVPGHAGGDLGHPDVEFGFVMSRGRGGYFCRYWSKHTPGELRKKANSELTPDFLLVQVDSVPQRRVDKAIERVEGDTWTC